MLLSAEEAGAVQRPSPRRPRTANRARDERGAAALLVAVSLSGLLIAVAMVLDFGVVRMDRQQTRLALDSAALAGLHSGDGGTGQLYTERAVCGALEFLRVNEPSLGGLASCPFSSTSGVLCSTSNPSTVATYTSSTVENGITSTVKIKAPYAVTEDGFAASEAASTSLSADTGSGCDQIGVLITRSRQPGLGSLATSSNLIYRLRSVGRVEKGRGDDAPAFLLLERRDCRALDVGSAGAGAGSHIYVRGFDSTPGTIHSDSSATGSNCGTGTNEQLFLGKQADGIVAFGGNTGGSGIISSVATANGVGDATVFDSDSNVYGTNAAYPSTAGTHSKVRGRGEVTRSIVDEQYRAGVVSAISAAASETADPVTPTTPWSLTSTAANANGWRVVTCSGGGGDLAGNLAALSPALTSADKLFIDCDPGSGISIGTSAAPITIDAGKVYINGWIGGGGLRFPNATRIWVKNPSNKPAAISLSSGTGFCMRGTPTTTTCSEATPFVSRCSTTSTGSITTHGQLFIRQGRIEMGAGLLRLCSTTVFMLGGDNSQGCVPSSNGALPTNTPCPSSSGGTGQINTTGGQVDWLAPNDFASVIPEATKTAAWNAQEDLAMWSESYGGSTGSNRFKMAGGAGMNTKGVFMVPNAHPFNITGGGSQTLTNAQYIARTFSVDGGATLDMTVDPNNAVTLPKLSPFYLVR